MKISQIFGPTLQGEGSAAGRHCLFVRTFNCNLECSWCDTAYTWAVTPEKAAKTRTGQQYDKYDVHLGEKALSAENVIDYLKELWDVEKKPTIIVVSGGEPMMQQYDLIPLLARLKSWGNEIHIETAGTISPTPDFHELVTQYNCSPKLSNSGNLLKKRYKPEVLRDIRDKAWFKFVVTSDYKQDFTDIDLIVYECNLDPRRVMVMPEGSEPSKNIETAQLVADAALRRGFGLSFRTHVLLWGDDPDK